MTRIAHFDIHYVFVPSVVFLCVWVVSLGKFFAISNHNTLLKTPILIPTGIDLDFVEPEA